MTSQLIPEHFVIKSCQDIKEKKTKNPTQRNGERELIQVFSFWHFHIQGTLRSLEVSWFLHREYDFFSLIGAWAFKETAARHLQALSCFHKRLQRIIGSSCGCRSPHLSSNVVKFSSHLHRELSLVAALEIRFALSNTCYFFLLLRLMEMRKTFSKQVIFVQLKLSRKLLCSLEISRCKWFSQIS